MRYSHPVRAPRGPERTAKGWLQEAAKRMLLHNLEPDNAELPERSSSTADAARPPAPGTI